MRKVILFFFLNLFLIGTAIAESSFTEEMETDRPDFTEGTKTIEPGHFQAELGYSFASDDEDGVEIEEHVLPETLLRYGVNPDLELRLTWGGYSFTEIDQSGTTFDEDGGNDIGLGFKHRLIEESDFSLSLLGELSLPVGARSKTSDNLDSQLSFLLAKDLAEGFSLSSNLNFSYVTEGDERLFEPSASLALAYDISESLGSYVEYFGFYPTERESSDRHFLNGGFTYALSEDLQLDVLAGFGLNDAADDFFTGLGLSFRI